MENFLYGTIFMRTFSKERGDIMDQKDLFWEEFLQYLSKNLEKEPFKRWVSNVKPLDLENYSISIAVKNELTKNYWQNNLSNYILRYSLDTYGQEFFPTFVVIPDDNFISRATKNPNMLHQQNATLTTPSEHTEDLSDNPLNPSYVFNTFVVGDGNKMAHVAAQAVCDKPGTVYNPLLIYGGTGLGKTHLMHAIGNEIKRRNPSAKIKYATSESFMNDFVSSIQNNLQKEFREMYRNIDLLLIDDIQFLSDKNKTQEEFFHTFNELQQSGKQIVLTSDRPPDQIANLEARLVSRFKHGLPTEIWPPDLETRIAILRKKAFAENLDVDSATLSYIANHVDTNVRELEGALRRVLAYAVTYSKDITVNLAAEALQSLIYQPGKKQLTINDIIHEVAKFYQVQQDEIKGKKRNKEFVHPRQIAMYLSRELLEVSFPKIGEKFGNRNHTTVMHAYDKVLQLLKEDTQVKQDVQSLTQMLSK